LQTNGGVRRPQPPQQPEAGCLAPCPSIRSLFSKANATNKPAGPSRRTLHQRGSATRRPLPAPHASSRPPGRPGLGAGVACRWPPLLSSPPGTRHPSWRASDARDPVPPPRAPISRRNRSSGTAGRPTITAAASSSSSGRCRSPHQPRARTHPPPPPGFANPDIPRGAPGRAGGVGGRRSAPRHCRPREQSHAGAHRTFNLFHPRQARRRERLCRRVYRQLSPRLHADGDGESGRVGCGGEPG